MAVKGVRENVVERELVKRVQAVGGVCEKTQAIGSRGFFDRVVVLPGGRVIFCECKRPQGGVLTIHQRQRHAQYRALGAVVEVVRNLADIDRLLS